MLPNSTITQKKRPDTISIGSQTSVDDELSPYVSLGARPKIPLHPPPHITRHSPHISPPTSNLAADTESLSDATMTTSSNATLSTSTSDDFEDFVLSIPEDIDHYFPPVDSDTEQMLLGD